MAAANFFDNLKNRVRSVYNNFFYDGGEAPLGRMNEAYDGEYDQPYPSQPQGGMPQYTQAPVAPQSQQPVYQPYQQPSFQQPQYQQPVYPQMPAQAQPRNRRMQQHAAQQESNVVDFGAYQQQNQAAPAFPPQQAPEPAAPQQSASLVNARVINARGMGDCRSAITLLRNGDAVLIVLENISDPGEMRRLVDTLSGACYSLTATITKVSRYGVYLLAPQSVAVFADQATNSMNSAPARPQARNYQPGYAGGQRVTYAPQAAAQPPQNNPYAGQQGFTQQAPLPEEAAANFYQRSAPQAAQPPAFSAQPAGYGYAPDEALAAEQ